MTEFVTSRWGYVGMSLSVAFFGTYITYAIARVVVPIVERYLQRKANDKIVKMLSREGVKRKKVR